MLDEETKQTSVILGRW